MRTYPMSYLNSPPWDQTNSSIHTNQPALSERAGMAPGVNGARAVCLNDALLMMMDWYAGWATATLQRGNPCRGESRVNKGERKTFHMTWCLLSHEKQIDYLDYHGSADLTFSLSPQGCFEKVFFYTTLISKAPPDARTSERRKHVT